MSLALGACEESSCDTSTRTAVQLKFYTRITDSLPRDSVIALDVEGIYGVGKEDSLLYEGISTESVSLPLPLDRDSCSFVIEMPGRSDTLSLVFSRQLRYLSRGCGFVTYYDIRDARIRGDAALNIVIKEPSVSTSNEENIKLYY